MKYLLDTCVLSDFVRGHPQLVGRLLAEPPRAIAVSSLTQMEIEYGLLLNHAREKKLRPALEALLGVVSVLPFHSAEALAAARVRSVLREQGRPIGPYDILLAGTALARQLVLVTSNTQEFARVPHLDIEDWRLAKA